MSGKMRKGVQNKNQFMLSEFKGKKKTGTVSNKMWQFP